MVSDEDQDKAVRRLAERIAAAMASTGSPTPNDEQGPGTSDVPQVPGWIIGDAPRRTTQPESGNQREAPQWPVPSTPSAATPPYEALGSQLRTLLLRTSPARDETGACAWLVGQLPDEGYVRWDQDRIGAYLDGTALPSVYALIQIMNVLEVDDALRELLLDLQQSLDEGHNVDAPEPAVDLFNPWDNLQVQQSTGPEAAAPAGGSAKRKSPHLQATVALAAAGVLVPVTIYGIMAAATAGGDRALPAPAQSSATPWKLAVSPIPAPLGPTRSTVPLDPSGPRSPAPIAPTPAPKRTTTSAPAPESDRPHPPALPSSFKLKNVVDGRCADIGNGGVVYLNVCDDADLVSWKTGAEVSGAITEIRTSDDWCLMLDTPDDTVRVASCTAPGWQQWERVAVAKDTYQFRHTRFDLCLSAPTSGGSPWPWPWSDVKVDECGESTADRWWVIAS